jgi:hypothetical protein
MRSKIYLTLSAVTLATCFSLPAMAQTRTPSKSQSSSSAAGTPITNQYGARGTSPNASTWLQTINEQYKLPTATPVTDQYASSSQRNTSVWAEAIRSQYKLSSHPTPVTDQYGATGTSRNSSTWYERIKEQYKIGT